VLIATKQAGEGEGFNPVGVDTLGPVVRGCLKAIVRNATQRVWWVQVRYALILTQCPRVLVSVTLSVCIVTIQTTLHYLRRLNTLNPSFTP